MNKKYALLLSFIGLSIFLFACDQLPQSDYLLWRNSEEATDLNGDSKIDELDYDLFLNPEGMDYETWRNSEDSEDLNGDRKIDELDYEIYLNQGTDDYETWRNSEDAEDLNGDRKINELDYDLYLNPPVDPYEIWLGSEDAKDYNLDDTIDEEDFAIYTDFLELAGSYTIANYTYEGTNTYIGNKIYLKDFALHLENIELIVDLEGNIDAQITQELITLLDDTYSIFLEGLENMTIERISPLLFAIDTTVTIEGIELAVSLYLTEIENGFSTSYTINFQNVIGIVKFDIIKDSVDATS